MQKTYNPGGIAGPFGHYDHGVEAVNVSRLLHVSGQVGTDPRRRRARFRGGADRARLAQHRGRAGGGRHDARNVVRTITYMLDAAYMPLLGAARQRHLGADHKAASTTIVVAGLVRPEWKVEIDAVAVA